MAKKVTVLGAVAALALAVNVQDAQAFAPATFAKTNSLALFAEEGKPADAVFVPAEATDAAPAEETPAGDDVSLEAAEMLGRGAAKVCTFWLLSFSPFFLQFH